MDVMSDSRCQRSLKAGLVRSAAVCREASSMAIWQTRQAAASRASLMS
eukprot:CAMPEP_0172213088 /NCGR_PEP_ID=MMETSP1050-20130122/37394_1 /TAXON_ID=233186 /ORGANISM="Cryptomonas curvata, Strain CCAP979/52" /LENGTH=47 /DNA_ID= /DNA_START= /DNA_END= /DNA_ORIENTATION=